MAKTSDVLMMLCPDSEWLMTNDDFDSIVWLKGKKITKAQFEEGLANFDAWKTEKETEKATAKAALLDRLGITAEEAALLLA
jgi:hypothetical protein